MMTDSVRAPRDAGHNMSYKSQRANDVQHMITTSLQALSLSFVVIVASLHGSEEGRASLCSPHKSIAWQVACEYPIFDLQQGCICSSIILSHTIAAGAGNAAQTIRLTGWVTVRLQLHADAMFDAVHV